MPFVSVQKTNTEIRTTSFKADMGADVFISQVIHFPMLKHSASTHSSFLHPFVADDTKTHGPPPSGYPSLSWM